MAKTIENLLRGNRNWVKATTDEDPNFFETLAEGQSPQFLWIGCSDSRVPATQITGVEPGSIFVQRNIANMVVYTDSNLMSVVYYAVKYLKVKHIIVCGHYGCGGVEAAMTKKSFGYLDNWLTNIKDVYSSHSASLKKISNDRERFDKMVELNVAEQVKKLAKISFIQEEWQERELPRVHGWVYSLKDGLLKDLDVSIGSSDACLDDIFYYEK